MLLTCPGCGHQSDLPDDRLPPAGARGRCGACTRTYTFDGRALVDPDRTPVRPMDAVSDEVPAAAGLDSVPSIPFAVPLPEPEPEPATEAAVADSTQWRVRGRGATEEELLDVAEVKRRIRTFELNETDDVVPPGETAWTAAAAVPALQRWFLIRSKTTVVTAGPVVAEGSSSAQCVKHRALLAAWNCTSCHVLLCESCVVVKDLGSLRGVRTCHRCGGACVELKLEQAILPFWRDIPSLLAYPLRGWGVAALLLCALTSFAKGIAVGLVAPIILGCCLLTYHLFILRKSAEGSKRLPDLGHVEDIIDQMVLPGIKAIIVSLVVAVPLFYYLVAFVAPAAVEAAGSLDDSAWEEPAGPEEVPASEREEAWQEARDTMGDEASPWVPDDAPWPPPEPAGDDEGWSDTWADESAEEPSWQEPQPVVEDDGLVEPGWTPSGRYDDEEHGGSAGAGFGRLGLHLLIFAGLCLYALVTWPILLIIVGMYNTIAPAFNPAAVFRVLAVIKKEYAICVAFVAVLMGAGLVLQVPFLLVPIAGRILGAMVFFYFSFIAFHVMGRLAQMAERKLGW